MSEIPWANLSVIVSLLAIGIGFASMVRTRRFERQMRRRWSRRIIYSPTMSIGTPHATTGDYQRTMATAPAAFIVKVPI